MDDLKLMLITFFHWVLVTSFMAAVVIGLIVLLKALFKDRIPIQWQYAMWFVLILRLLLPWTPESSLSVFNLFADWQIPIISQTEEYQPRPSEISPLPGLSGGEGMDVNAPAPRTTMESGQLISQAEAPNISAFQLSIVIIWLLGMAIMVVYLFKNDRKFVKKIRTGCKVSAGLERDLLEQCKQLLSVKSNVSLIVTDHVSTPTLYDWIRPKILMPKKQRDTYQQNELKYIFLHELIHLKRKDILVNWLMTGLLILHWFNPLLWYAYQRMREDQESSCDAKAISYLPSDEVKPYGQTLIKLLTQTSRSFSSPAIARLLTGRSQLKRRMRRIALYGKASTFWTLLGGILVLLLSSLALTNATGDQPDDQNVTIDPPSKISMQLSGEDEGLYHQVVVEAGDLMKSFDWKHVTNPSYTPFTKTLDIDGDGKQEYVIILTSGYGTDVLEQELHVLDLENLSEWNVEDPVAAVRARTTSEIINSDEDVIASIQSRDDHRVLWERNFQQSDVGMWYSEVGFGAIVQYDVVDDQIVARILGSVSPAMHPVEVIAYYDRDLNVDQFEFVGISSEESGRTAMLSFVLDKNLISIAEEGILQGIDFPIGTPKQELLEKLGEPDTINFVHSEELKYGNTTFYVYPTDDLVHVIDVEIDHSVEKVKEILGEPSLEGMSDAGYVQYDVLYEAGVYSLLFFYSSEEAESGTLRFKNPGRPD